MPQPIIPINCISSPATYRLDAAYLALFMQAIYNYEPALGAIIEEMCGVFKRQQIKPIITAVLDHYMTFLPNNPMSLGGYAQWRNHQNMTHIRSTMAGPSNVGVYVGHAVDNDLIGLHTDIMLGHHINQTGNTNRGFNRDENIDRVCQHWGLVWRAGEGYMAPEEREQARCNTSMNMIKSMLNNQVDGECCIIFSMINPTYHDNMCSAHSKEMVEIVMPRSTEYMDTIINNIPNDEIIYATEKNYSKVYRGLFVESLRRHLNIPRPMMMSEEQNRYWNQDETHRTLTTMFDRYYDNYLTRGPRSIQLLTQT